MSTGGIDRCIIDMMFHGVSKVLCYYSLLSVHAEPTIQIFRTRILILHLYFFLPRLRYYTLYRERNDVVMIIIRVQSSRGFVSYGLWRGILLGKYGRRWVYCVAETPFDILCSSTVLCRLANTLLMIHGPWAMGNGFFPSHR